LALVGHSAGGYLALMGGAADLRFRAIVALCPLVSSTRTPLAQQDFVEFAQMLHGISAEELSSQYYELPPVETVATQLRGRPVLIITGREDTVFPPEHYPPLKEAVPTIEWHEFDCGDHSLSLCRREAADLTVRWLSEQLGT
jgi:acetyl esterase/lipase